jgi:hypothetical protein
MFTQDKEYVRLGCAYNKWAEELGGPGFLLVLPLTITEYQWAVDSGLEVWGIFSACVS